MRRSVSWLVSFGATEVIHPHRLPDQSTIWPRGVIGLLSADNESLTPLLFPDFRPVSTLHHLIEQWDEVSDRLLPGTPVEQMSAVKLLAPLRGRDVIGVGYNYKAHHE